MDWIDKLKDKGIEVTEETVKLVDLHLDPKNANIHPPHQIESLEKSLDVFGQPERLIVSGDGRIIGGNGRFEAMKNLGWEHARITRIHADDKFLNALGIALNKTAESSFLDKDIVADILADLEDETLIFATGFSETEINTILDLEDDDFFDVDDEDEEEEKPKRPTASADGYSSFEIVMRYENKKILVDLLDSIRKDNDMELLEDALMEIVTKYKGGKK